MFKWGLLIKENLDENFYDMINNIFFCLFRVIHIFKTYEIVQIDD